MSWLSFKTEKCIVTGPSQMSRLLRHIHCVQRAIVLESLIPLHLAHSTEQQLLRYGEGYCHVNREVCTVIKQSNHCLLSKLDDVFKCTRKFGSAFYLRIFIIGR